MTHTVQAHFPGQTLVSGQKIRREPENFVRNTGNTSSEERENYDGS